VTRVSTGATELAGARDALDRLLALLGLAGYRFELSADGDGWDIDLECQAPDGWQTLRLRLPRWELGQAATDAETRQRLLEALDERLRGCLRQA
jgi:hypothetical protein